MTKANQFRALMVTAWVLAASLLGLFTAGEPAEAAFPGIPNQYGKIVFDSNRPAAADGTTDSEIYVMDADGSNQTPLTNEKGNDAQAAWSPDGKRIAFQSSRPAADPTDPSTDFEIYVMDADGSNQTPLTNNNTIEFGPAWSPDGTKLAYTSNQGGDQEVWVMNADGTGQTPLTNNLVNDSQPNWSPNGEKVAFTSRRDGDDEILVMKADGSGQTPLTNNLVSDAQPNWSPDGKKIAFASLQGDTKDEIYVMNAADGSDQKRLTNNPGVHDGRPAWSADGKKIVYVNDQDGTSTLSKFEIYTINADGSNPRPLTTNSATDTKPDWQPLLYDFEGFSDPVDNPPTLNSAKAGSAIPVKFGLTGDQGLDILASGFPKSQDILCDSTAQIDGVEETVTANESGLTYDLTSDEYTYVWKTEKAWAGTCRQLVVKLSDGTSHRANFQLK